jgi:hypothetical protein
MAGKRKAAGQPPGVYKRANKRYKKKAKPRFAGRAGIAHVVNTMLTKKLETKQSVFTASRYQQKNKTIISFFFFDIVCPRLSPFFFWEFQHQLHR